MLTTRQWRLKDFLERNHIDGKYWSIEEIVENVRYRDGSKCYELNTNPRSHDKCVALGSDVKAINWDIQEGQKIIIKDKKGGIKLAENEAEFNAWRTAELEKVESKYQYLNNLKWKAKRDGTMPIINQAMNVVDTTKDLKEVNCYTDKKFFKRAFVNLHEKQVFIVNMVKYHYDDIKREVQIDRGIEDEKLLISDIDECISLEALERPFYESYQRIEV